jgi:hypothetical protein
MDIISLSIFFMDFDRTPPTMTTPILTNSRCTLWNETDAGDCSGLFITVYTVLPVSKLASVGFSIYISHIHMLELTGMSCSTSWCRLLVSVAGP